MLVAEQPVDQLDRYLCVCEVLDRIHHQLYDDLDLRGYVADAAKSPADRLDGVVGTLCQQAGAARQLASAAESLCAALVAERYHPKP